MKQTIQQVLIQHWGFNHFRPLQEEIILSVLKNEDTLALLPTGGGKSICFQVPALVKEGICIVISPLIALMKDQVASLNKKGIKAFAIHTGMHSKEIDLILETCIYAKIKFLYLSPERLQSEIVKERLKSMNINLIAVDEAHCISQWGYDFRPSYVKIAEIRQILPLVPILALTATATPIVIKDIQEKLLFKKEHVFTKSFYRSNLSYQTYLEDDKLSKLLRIIDKNPGSGIIYVRSRKKTKELTLFLLQNNIKADFYHAGLDMKLRDIKQQDWLNDRTRIMICTNAFGMGIDKSDVRFVIHYDIPDSIEAYFQEAGRAGRDEKNAIAVLLYNEANIDELEQNFKDSYPEINTIKNIYLALGNYFKITIGAGEMQSFPLDMNDFISQYNFRPVVAFKALQFLEKEGYIMLTESFNESSKLNFPITKDLLYQFQIANPKFDPVIKTLQRAYTGLFSDFVKISESDIAKKLNTTETNIVKTLEILHKFGIVIYDKLVNQPKVTYLTPRTDKDNIIISDENYDVLKENARKRLNAILNYVKTNNKCRNQMLLKYFGEDFEERCGICDYCIGRNKISLSKHDFDHVITKLKPLLKNKPLTLDDIVRQIDINEDKVLGSIIWLLDHKKIIKTENGLMRWNSKDNE